MSIETLEEFKGLYTAADKYSTPGSPSMNDWDIDMSNNLVKSKGVTRITPDASGTTAAYITVTSIQISGNAVITSPDAHLAFTVSSPVIFYSINSTVFSAVVCNKAWNISAIAPGEFTVEGCDTSALTGTGITAKVDPSISHLKGFIGATGAVLSNIECQGAYYDSTTDYVYSFLANKTSGNSYLTWTDKDAVMWKYSEASGGTAANCTAFGTTYDAFIKKYSSNIIFTKNESQSGLAGFGGTFTLSATGSIICYGTTNNPTGKYIEVHKERVWVGNISYISDVNHDGGSWVQVSKFLPEKADTTLSIVGSGIVFGNGTAKIVVSTHAYAVGDTIYLSGVVVSGVQNDLNQHLYDIVGMNSSSVVINYNNVNTLEYSSAGSVLLRGSTWGTAMTLYEDSAMGAGLFRCDDNNDDKVMQLQSSFGAMAILRQQNPYIFTGAIESGDQTLARPLNVSYGAVSPHTVVTAGGSWFISQYGVSKIEGTSVKTNNNQLDNIVDVTVIEPIRPTYEDIQTKSGLIMHSINRLLIVHDKEHDISYVLDTLNGNWFRWYSRCADRMLSVGEDDYAIYKYFMFKMQDGNQVWNLANYRLQSMTSSYFTRVMAQQSIVNTKVYNMIFSLLEGSSSSAATNPITINVYYNGSASPSFSFAWDVKTDTIETWDSLTTNGTLSWNTVTTNATVTWVSLLGALVSMFEKRKYRLGSAKEIQLEIQHSDNSEVKISKIYMDYDVLMIDTL